MNWKLYCKCSEIVMLLLVLSACGQQQTSHRQEPEIALWIQNKPVLIADFKREVEVKIKTWVVEDELTDEDFARIVDTVINELAQEQVLRREAEHLNIQIDKSALKLSSEKQKYPEGFEALEKADEIWKKRISQKFELMMISQKIAENLHENISIDEETTLKFYEENIQRFTEPESFDLRVIQLNDPDLAKDISKKLRKGWKFSTLAKNYSSKRGDGADGELYRMHAGEFPQNIEENLANMKPGRISDILSSEDGYYIFKLEKKYPSVILPFDDVKDSLQEELFLRKKSRLFKDWLDAEVEKLTIRQGTPIPFPGDKL